VTLTRRWQYCLSTPTNVGTSQKKKMRKYINLQTALWPKCKRQGIITTCTRGNLDSFHHNPENRCGMSLEI